MQDDDLMNLMCPKHREQIVSVSFQQSGENHKFFCLKCLTSQQMTIQQIAQQLTEQRQRKIMALTEQGYQSEKRLEQLKKLFLNWKEQFNQHSDQIIKILNDEINTRNKYIKEEIERLNQSIQSLNITQVTNYLNELKKQQELNNDQFFNSDRELRERMLKQHTEQIELLNKQVEKVQDNQQNDNQSYLNQMDKGIIKSQEQVRITKFQLFQQEKGIHYCYAIATDKDQKILINGQNSQIQVRDFNNEDGTIKLKQTLVGHVNDIEALCFSLKEYWFISGSYDNSIRIWQRRRDNWWICQQVIENAHQDYVRQIVMTKEEDQFISGSDDKKINVWMNNGNQWKCVQTLTGHTSQIRHLSLNVESNLLASSGGNDELRLWEKDQDQVWKLKQVVHYPNDFILRCIFIGNNELIATTKKLYRLLKYTQNNKGLFLLILEWQLNEINSFTPDYFPIVYNKQTGLLIVIHSQKLTYLIKRQDNGDLTIHQVLNGDYRTGLFIKEGKWLVLANQQTAQLELLK